MHQWAPVSGLESICLHPRKTGRQCEAASCRPGILVPALAFPSLNMAVKEWRDSCFGSWLRIK